jgi:hypothetical protein
MNHSTTLAAALLLVALSSAAAPAGLTLAVSAGWAADGGAVAAFPARSDHAPTGRQFLVDTWRLAPAEREAAILAQIRAGNVPGHLRRLVPLSVRHAQHTATLYVLPDYLALGSDDDYIIIPMAPGTAVAIAREFGFTLPTRKLVDDIYAHSTLRLAPQPMPPGQHMDSNAYYRLHDRHIKSQLAGSSGPLTLVAGHKKDIVLTPRLSRQPSRVAIYGWHTCVGSPIQPLSLYHPADYVDYSHGVRLISRRALVDGREADLSQVLSDRELNPLVSDEGFVSLAGYL